MQLGEEGGEEVGVGWRAWGLDVVIGADAHSTSSISTTKSSSKVGQLGFLPDLIAR